MVYQRVLLKLSGEALMGSLCYGIDPIVVQSIAQEVAKSCPKAFKSRLLSVAATFFAG